MWGKTQFLFGTEKSWIDNPLWRAGGMVVNQDRDFNTWMILLSRDPMDFVPAL